MKKTDMKVLVVGGAGYIGGAVTDELIARGIPFSVYDNLLYEERYLKPVDFIYGDVRDTEKLAKILPHYTHVIWLAAIVGDGACAIHPEAAVEINELAVKRLAELFDGRIVFTSTCSVYGHSEGERTEEHKPTPLSLYTTTKVNAEQYLLQKNALILRLGTAFGISDAFSRPRFDLLVNTFAANAVLKGKIMVFGGSQWRPTVHVRDIAEIIAAGLTSPARGIYNIATENYTVGEVAQKIVSLTGCELQYADRLREDIRNYRVSVAKAVSAGFLKLTAKRDILYGAKEVIELIKSGRLKDAGRGTYFNVRHLSQFSI